MQKLFNRIVLIDDDDISNYLTSRILNRAEIALELIILNNGQQALDFFQSQPNIPNPVVKRPDLVLLDINMAVMNGFELLEVLRYTNYLDNVKVVILSSSHSSKDVAEAAVYRISDYLTKPLDAEKLKHIVDSISNSQAVKK
jgi:CheY-like chemotaxis protein